MRPGAVEVASVTVWERIPQTATGVSGSPHVHRARRAGPHAIGLDVPWPQQLAGGRASALFAVLAGVSMALVSGRQQPVRGRERYAVSARLAVRALLIGALGLLLGVVPSGIAVILSSVF